MASKTVEQRYKKLTQVEHILHRPHMYIGDIKTAPREMFVVENPDEPDDPKIVRKQIDYNPGFVKIFDEIITNASDHYIRTKKVTKIKVDVTSTTITVENDGPGIPVEIHKDVKAYVPEMLFAHLMTGENYDDDEERIVGGLNGLGAKLTNIYSKEFQIDTADGSKCYKQTFRDNMSTNSRGQFNKATITPKRRNYTKITYTPDFEKFEMTEIDKDHISVLLKRTLDIAAYSPKLKVYWNGRLLKVNSFQDYMKMHLDDDAEFMYEKINDRWEIGIAKSDGAFQHVSMVNGLSTYEGGTHVAHIANFMVNEIKENLLRGNKKLTIKTADIKNKLFLFVNCNVVNPDFTSQTKETLTTRMTQAATGGAEPSATFVKKVCKSDIVKEILDYLVMRDHMATQKNLRSAVTGKPKVKKLEDANRAGKSDAYKCALFVAEGDSAKSTCVAGFSVTGRDHFGAYPVKGKPLNVRDVSAAKIRENDELKDIIAALGLEFGKKYEDTKSLRYGKLVLMSDMDHDGYHIKGLLINIFDTFWPELLKLDFLYEFVTPVIKAKKGTTDKYFYKLSDYRKWSKTVDTKGWYVKYYKGLGTIMPSEAKMFFQDIDKHLIRFHMDDEKRSRDLIDMAFRRTRVDDRKQWLTGYQAKDIDKFARKTTYENFMDEEFIEFSMADNIRSIPSVVDGLKPSQRKILYTMLESNFKNEVNVSELFGYVKSKAAYHHGSASLDDGIINMAQDFVGANNLNLLLPNGQFGTRLHGGKDASAPRYIFTELSPITRYVYRKDDEALLSHAVEDGKEVEPVNYLPVIPMVLVNGSNGIGTGWSTNIPMFQPMDVIEWFEKKLAGTKPRNLNASYRGFTGQIIQDDGKYVTKGKIEKVHTTKLQITELPIGTWNDRYYEHLDQLAEDKIIVDYTNFCTDTDINIEVKITRATLSKMTDDELYNVFDLTSNISTKNMYAFDADGRIVKYEDANDICEYFFDYRLGWYGRRKEYLIEKLTDDKKWLTNKVNFVKYILGDKLKVMKRKRDLVEADMEKLKLDRKDESYDYLLNMSLVSLTAERLAELKSAFLKKEEELKEVISRTPEDMWKADLAELKKEVLNLEKTRTSGSSSNKRRNRRHSS